MLPEAQHWHELCILKNVVKAREATFVYKHVFKAMSGVLVKTVEQEVFNCMTDHFVPCKTTGMMIEPWSLLKTA